VARRYWLLSLVLWLMCSSCAMKSAPAAPKASKPDYLVITDDVPNDAWICVPMMEWMAITPNTIRCMPVQTLRWMLRNQKKG
jgi:hypothetical protein